MEELWLQNQAVMDSLIRWEERMYLHTDRSAAVPGEHLFFKAYAMTGPRKLRVSPSKVLWVDLVDSDEALVSRQYYRLINGTASGALEIPEILGPDTYTLRAYTRWMQNYGSSQYFTREIQVMENPMVGPKVNPEAVATRIRPQMIDTISFHPEGGALLAGINNKLTIRSLDSMGAPVDIRGVITTTRGETRIPVEPYGEGLSMAIFNPLTEADYILRLDNGDVYPLPEVTQSGYTLHLNTLDKDHVRIIATAIGTEPETIRLYAKKGNAILLEEELDFMSDQQIKLDIPKAGLPAGLLVFALTDQVDKVLAERPVHIQNPGTLQMELIPIRSDFSRGGKNVFRLRVTGVDGRPVMTDLSFSARQNIQETTEDILEYTGSYARAVDLRDYRKSQFLEDLKALSTGHRPSQVYPENIRFPMQQGLELQAKVYNMYGELLQNTDVQVAGESDEGLIIREVRSDDRGVIRLTDLNVVGDTRLVFRTREEDKLARLVRAFPLQKRRTEANAQKEVEKVSKAYKRSQRKNPVVTSTPILPQETASTGYPGTRTSVMDMEYDTTGLIKLSEATVDGRKRQRKLNPTIHGIQPLDMNVVYQDAENPMPMSVLVQKIPGMVVMLDGGNNPTAWSNRTRANPIWVLDGEIMGRINTTFANFEQDRDPYFDNPFYVVPSADIERIEFVYDPYNTSLFGAGAIEAGVIIVYTRSAGETRYFNRKNAGLDFQGFEPDLGFDSYLERRRGNRKLRKQAPATIYWDPSVQTDEKGEALIQFESPGDYDQAEITVETLTPDGRTGSLRLVLDDSTRSTDTDY